MQLGAKQVTTGRARRASSRARLSAWATLFVELVLLVSATSACRVTALILRPRRPPNVVLIVADDLGWADLGCMGAQDIQTPHIDRLALEGVRFTDYYSGGAVCTPGRAALLTGCHAKRLGLAQGALFPYSENGLAAEEVTLAELLRARGYATGCFGKWHLGHVAGLLPLDQGFDSFFGVPYSHDMDRHLYEDIGFQAPPLPLLRNGGAIEESPDPALLTQRFTDEALAFLANNAERPFFLYLAPVMPHLPLAVSPEFEGHSAAGLYGDAIEELDDAVGRILAALLERGLDDETLVLFTSDNGSWHPGSAGPLRGRKNTTWEGGMRVPCLVRWPSRIPAGQTCSELVTALDVLPTVAALAGAQVPLDRTLDGHDVRPLLFGERGAKSPTEAFPYYREDRLEALRSGNWKLHVARPEWEDPSQAPLLFDLATDPGETQDVAADHPEEVDRLLKLVKRFRARLGDAVTGSAGSGK